MCVIDLEPSDVWRETTRKARKEHVCSSCRGVILQNDVYLEHFSLFEGYPTRAKMCSLCHRDRAVFSAAHSQMLCTPIYFPDALEECIHDGDEESDLRWRPMLEAMRGRAADVPRAQEGASRE